MHQSSSVMFPVLTTAIATTFSSSPSSFFYIYIMFKFVAFVGFFAEILLILSTKTYVASIAAESVTDTISNVLFFNNNLSSYSNKPRTLDNIQSLTAYVSQPNDQLPIKGAEKAVASLKEFALNGHFGDCVGYDPDRAVAMWIAHQVTDTGKSKADSLMEFRILHTWVSKHNTEFQRKDTAAQQMLTTFLVDAVELGGQGELAAMKILADYTVLVNAMKSVGVQATFTGNQYLKYCWLSPIS
ncbi:hypothetical protein BDF19DRAFT_468751 [Syncephalis fuscata]|nr:hypothetical protein BDF19DRAFT_468751 [Syncephalis fuscata]